MNTEIRQEIASQIRGNLAGLISAGVLKQVLLDMVSSIEQGTAVEIITLGDSGYRANEDYANWDNFSTFIINDELVWIVEGDSDHGYRFETATYKYTVDGAGYSRITKQTQREAVQEAKEYADEKVSVVSGSLNTETERATGRENTIESGSVQRDQNITQNLNTEIHDREQAVANLRAWVEQNYPNNTTVDSTYYKSGSNANLGNTATDDLLVRGNLTVEGSIVQTHEEDVQIRDKYVEIASGSRNPSEANGAGFAIMGASASMVYNSSDDTLEFNKELVAPYFHGTASVASDIQDDGVIATALLDMYNKVTPTVTSGSLTGNTYTLTGQAKKTVDSVTNSSYSTVTVTTGSYQAIGFEHSAFISCSQSTTFNFGSIKKPVSGNVTVAAGKTLAMTWTITNTGALITDLTTLS